MFRLYRAIISPLLKNRSIYFFQYIWDPHVYILKKRYGSVLKIKPDDGSIEPKHVAALNVL